MRAAGSAAFDGVLPADADVGSGFGIDAQDRRTALEMAVPGRPQASRPAAKRRLRDRAQARLTLVRKMGISALYRQPKTSRPGEGPQHRIYPYLLKGMTIERPNQVWAADISVLQ